jgi:DNA-binding PadR family transcriptional regulator
LDSIFDFRKRLIIEFLDILALKYIKDNVVLSGYDFIVWVQEKYGVLLSSGTVYTKVYGLERNGLIKGEREERKRAYTLTEKGDETIKSILSDPTVEQFLMLLEKPQSKKEAESVD